jgi:hypothetical protein
MIRMMLLGALACGFALVPAPPTPAQTLAPEVRQSLTEVVEHQYKGSPQPSPPACSDMCRTLAEAETRPRQAGPDGRLRAIARRLATELRKARTAARRWVLANNYGRTTWYPGWISEPAHSKCDPWGILSEPGAPLKARTINVSDCDVNPDYFQTDLKVTEHVRYEAEENDLPAAATVQDYTGQTHEVTTNPPADLGPALVQQTLEQELEAGRLPSVRAFLDYELGVPDKCDPLDPNVCNETDTRTEEEKQRTCDRSGAENRDPFMALRRQPKREDSGNDRLEYRGPTIERGGLLCRRLVIVAEAAMTSQGEPEPKEIVTSYSEYVP